MRGKILFVTGTEAASSVRRHSDGIVHVCSVDVAALLSMDRIGAELSKINLNGFSMIILPGLVSGDTSRLSKILGVPVYKGTKHSSDIRLLIENLGSVKLSTRIPADYALDGKLRENVKSHLEASYKKGKKFVMRIGVKRPVYLGKNSPMRVIAEIPDAPLLSRNDLKDMAEHYVKSGASIVDIGMISGVDNSKKIKNIVRVLRDSVNVPLSIDSMDVNEITAAVDAGVDLVLSVAESNIEVAETIDVPFVILPLDRRGKLPECAVERVKKLESLMTVLKGKHIILDPVLSPLNHGFVESLKAYSMLKGKYPRIPVVMGIGNITELVDADSVGMNALLAGVASEIGLELLFTVEASVKTQGCVRELSTAADMMHLAKIHGKNPKDLGLDLLEIKDKRKTELIEDPKTARLKYMKAKDNPVKMEQIKYRIYLRKNEILVTGYSKNQPTRGYKGTSAEVLYKKICSTTKISPEHAAYLGKELAKAEIALKLNKNYEQDEELFHGFNKT
ncbi:MAG: dihydropteroate synthase-like protein [Candidatus Altiarchaeota archaeon]